MAGVKTEEQEPGCQRELRLDIACGKNKKTGYSGVDIWEGADIVADLEKYPWPFEDESVDEIFCSHYIEHTRDLIAFANELYRILKTGARAEIIAPYYSSIRAWQDPTHLRAISENTFLYFNREWRLTNRLDHYPITADFDFESSYVLDPAWCDRSDDELQHAIRHYINVVSDIRTTLTKRAVCDEAVELQARQADELWESGRAEEAVHLCRDIVERHVGHLQAYLLLGEYSLQAGDAVGAINHFHMAAGLDDECVQAHVGLIRSLARSGRQEDATAHLDSIRSRDAALADLILGFVEATEQ